MSCLGPEARDVSSHNQVRRILRFLPYRRSWFAHNPTSTTKKAPKIPCLKLQHPTSPTIKPLGPHPTIPRTGCTEETNHASLRAIRSFPRRISWHTGGLLPLFCRGRGVIIEDTTISSQVRNMQRFEPPHAILPLVEESYILEIGLRAY